MPAISNLRLLLVSASTLAVAACSGASVSSPGEQNQVPPPSSGGGGSSNQTLNLIPAAGCPTGTSSQTSSVNYSGGTADVTACRITGNILTDLTIPAGETFFVSGPVFVGQDSGASGAGTSATLTIEAGASIVGESGNDYIVISRGAQIDVRGEVNDPVIMTSSADLLEQRLGTPRTLTDSSRGEWGGLIINGRAPINACIDGTATGGTVDCQKSGEGSSGLFGGATPTDSSGSLRYLQVRYAGFRVNNEDELNGIAFQGVGSGTTVEYVQVHNNEDDGIEFFGGAVNAKYVVLTGNADDSMDYTDGWVGNAQFILVRQSGDDGDQGFEFDNNGDENTALPRSNPTISNFTLLGVRTSSASDTGMLLREGTAGTLRNGIVVDFEGDCLDVDQDETFLQANSGALSVASVFFDCTPNASDDADGFSEADFIAGTGFAANTNNVEGSNTMSSTYFPGPAEQAVNAIDPTGLGGFFTAASYAGAFSPSETTSSNWAAGWTFGLFPPPSCPTGTTATSEVIQGQNVCRISGTLIDDLTLVGGLAYEIVGPIFVGRDVGADGTAADGNPAILTIEPGVTLFGSAGGDYIVVSRGSEIRSNGTASQPVIMTSRADLEGTQADPNSARGEWGGLIINGRAPINACIDGTATGGTVDCQKSGEGSSGLFGGADAADSSGSIRYTRVQYAGFRVNNEDELNGIAFQGVGSGTEVDYVQVHNNEDDGIEFFGGAVNAKHLVLTGNADDSLDYTDGWVGNVQYVIVQHATDDGDQGFEFDNNGDENTALPRSNPTISNFTLIGQRASAASDTGMLLREGTAATLRNGIVVDFEGDCLDVDQFETFTQATSGALSVASVFFDCTPNASDDADGFSEADFIAGTGFAANVGNVEGDATGLLGGFSFITDMTNNRAKGVVPQGALGVTPIDPSAIDPFFDAATYVGAVENGSDTWYQGWTLQQQ